MHFDEDHRVASLIHALHGLAGSIRMARPLAPGLRSCMRERTFNEVDSFNLIKTLIQGAERRWAKHVTRPQLCESCACLHLSALHHEPILLPREGGVNESTYILCSSGLTGQMQPHDGKAVLVQPSVLYPAPRTKTKPTLAVSARSPSLVCLVPLQSSGLALDTHALVLDPAHS